MKVNVFSLFLLLFLTTLVLSSIYFPFRYLKYLLPLAPFLIFYNRKNGLIVDKKVFNYYSAFLTFYVSIIGYLFLQNLLFSSVSSRFFPNAIFILSPLLFIVLILPFFNNSKVPQYISLIFIINIFFFFYEEGMDLASVLVNLTLIKNAFISSNIPTESNLAFVFGFFVIYFILEKEKRVYQIIAILFFILCFKRIAIAAVFLSLSIYWIFSLLRIDVSRYRKAWALVGVLMNFAFVKMVTLIVSGTFDEWIKVATGFRTDRFLMGRQGYYTEIFDKVPANWLGIGLGKIDDIMFNLMKLPWNLHSEVLKNYFEFGFIIFAAWLYLVFYKNLFSNKAAVFLLYFNVLILTDNVFIYSDIMFYFYFFVLIYLSQKNEQPKIAMNELALDR